MNNSNLPVQEANGWILKHKIDLSIYINTYRHIVYLFIIFVQVHNTHLLAVRVRGDTRTPTAHVKINRFTPAVDVWTVNAVSVSSGGDTSGMPRGRVAVSIAFTWVSTHEWLVVMIRLCVSTARVQSSYFGGPGPEIRVLRVLITVFCNHELSYAGVDTTGYCVGTQAGHRWWLAFGKTCLHWPVHVIGSLIAAASCWAFLKDIHIYTTYVSAQCSCFGS